MIEIGKLYVKNSVPLKEVENLAIGEEYYNEEGHCLKYVGEDQFVFTKQSPLISSELISELKDDKTLRLFWVLAKNM